MFEFIFSYVNFMKINLNMLEIPVIWKPQDNHIELNGILGF
jgi:hypothetical protein